MGILGFFGRERVYTSVGLVVAAFVLVFVSYFFFPSDGLHAGARIGQTVYLVIIFTVLALIVYNVYYSLSHRKQERERTLEQWQEPVPAAEDSVSNQ
jgi:hypothetical protein